MDAVKNDVKRLVKIELAAANKKFRMFAGPHEGAGIIQEEVVEAAKEMNGLRRELNAMWIGVYSNNPQISTKGVYDRAVALAVEAIQTAAMARKFERSQRRNWPGAKEPHYDEEDIWPIRQTWSSGTEQGQSSGSRGRSCTRTLKILKLESWRQYHETERSNVYLQPVQKAGVRGTVRRWCV